MFRILSAKYVVPTIFLPHSAVANMTVPVSLKVNDWKYFSIRNLVTGAILVITCCNFQAKCMTKHDMCISHLRECVLGNVFCTDQGPDSHSGTVTSCLTF